LFYGETNLAESIIGGKSAPQGYTALIALSLYIAAKLMSSAEKIFIKRRPKVSADTISLYTGRAYLHVYEQVRNDHQEAILLARSLYIRE